MAAVVPGLSELRSLHPMALRLVAMRLLVYLGVQCSYFIGVVGTLSFALEGGVVENALGVVLMNGCMVLGSLVGGPLLDRVGPRRYFAFVVVALVATALSFELREFSVATMLTGAALLGAAMGMSDLVGKAFPAYLTDDPDELRRINSVVFAVSNVAIVVGPLAGGAVSAAVSPRAVFWLLAAGALLAAVPAWGFRPLREPERAPRAAGGPRAGAAALREGFSAVFGMPALSLLFWSCFLSFFGYGAFDPLESLYYRDVLGVGVEWMGWLSAAAGVGGVVGSLLVMGIPSGRLDARALLAALCAEGLACLVYVGTSSVAVACAGQVLLGVAFGALNPVLSTLVQLHAPLDVLGSVNSVMGLGSNLAGVLPLMCAPAIAGALGVQGTLVLASSMVFVVPMLIALVRRRLVARVVAEERALASGADAS